MEYIFEFILDLMLECSIEVSKNSKIPKIIRYILLVFIILFFLGVIGLIYLISLLMLKENAICSILFFLLATFFLVASFFKFKKTYIKKTNK